MPYSSLFSEEKLKSVCSNIPEIGQIELTRLKFRERRRKFVFHAVIIVTASFLISWLFNHRTVFVIAIFYDIIICSVLWVKKVRIVYIELLAAFQEKLVKRYAEALLQDAQYYPKKYHSLLSYYESLLYMIDIDRDSGENYVAGKFDKTDLSFSYMHTEYNHTKNGIRTSWHTIFRGIFMKADCNKNFSGKTLVLPKSAEKYFGKFGKRQQRNAAGEMVYYINKQFKRNFVVYSTDPVEAKYLITLKIQEEMLKIQNMENKQFKKNFVVYSTDPIEARYLITPKIQEEILKIQNFLQTGFRLSFVNSHVFFAVGSKKIFVMNTSLSFKDTATHLHYMKGILKMLNLVHLLDLNVRIWTKK
ncbi:MAG: DUF3137 domain-containing protein [Prevotellaceae bacterium]|jgi:hypothetical protein|nr:DUF3137 domain-containing protein [Prevotellaceae bacterium]